MIQDTLYVWRKKKRIVQFCCVVDGTNQYQKLNYYYNNLTLSIAYPIITRVQLQTYSFSHHERERGHTIPSPSTSPVKGCGPLSTADATIRSKPLG